MTTTSRWARSTTIAAGLVAVAAVLTWARYDHLPDAIPVLRSITGEPLQLAAKSPLLALRLSAMGAGQLGAAAIMAHEAGHAGHAGWQRFWQAAALTAGAKALLECVALTFSGTTWETVANASTIGVVLAFLGGAAWLWRGGALRGRHPMRAVAWVGLSLSSIVWAGFAVLPRWAL